MIYAIFFLSGVSALIFQHIWFRQAGLAFGNSVWATSLVLSSFMAGLALGNGLAAAGRVERKNPLLLYAMLELTVGLSGVGLVFVLPRLGQGLVPALIELVGSGPAVEVVRFGLAFVLLVVPTAAMGLTLPLLAARAPQGELFGVTLGRLYGWNTLGALLGALAGEAFLYEQVGIRNTAFIAGSLNVAAALLSLALVRSERPPNLAARESAFSVASGADIRLLIIAALAGGCFLGLEVIWTRFMLLFVFGNALTFAIMLAMALAGISLGSLLASRSPGFFATPVAAPILAMLGSIAVTASYAWFVDVLKIDLRDVPAPLWARVSALSAALILPTAMVSGALFTSVGSALARGRSATRATGFLTLANTFGAMVGALVAGFALLPVLGMERSFRSMAATYAFAGLVAPGFGLLIKRSRGLAAATLTALLFTLFFPSGLMQSTYLRGALRPFVGGSAEFRVTGFREGLTETITYVEELMGGEALYQRLITNSFSMSGTTFAARRYMESFVYLPVAIHPHIRRALLISYGVGVTASALTSTAEIERIDIVDISRDILEMAPLGVPIGERPPLSDPRVFTHIEDGRFFLQTSREGYDLITSEPPPPHLGGVVNLYTLQYFDLMKQRLNPGGVVSYWLPVHSLSDDDSRAISSAFCRVFPDCTLWKGMNLDWILVGTNGLRGPVSLERFRHQWAEGGRRLSDIGIEVPEQLGALFMADGASTPELTDALPLDDNYPGRLSRSPPSSLSAGAWKENLMDSGKGLQRFLASPFVSRAWPEEMRKATIPYFAIQRLYDDLLQETLSGRKSPESVNEAVSLIRETSLTVLPTILLGTSGETRLLARRIEARDGPNQDKGWLHAHLAMRDLAEKRFEAAEIHLRRALALDPASPGLKERLTLVLCMEGKTAEALHVREALSSSLDPGWAHGIDAACQGRRSRPL